MFTSDRKSQPKAPDSSASKLVSPQKARSAWGSRLWYASQGSGSFGASAASAPTEGALRSAEANGDFNFARISMHPKAPSAGALIQRKCDCGSASGTCDECRKAKQFGMQTKREVGEPGDIYEQEADRIMRMTTAEVSTQAPPKLRRMSKSQAGATEAPPIVDEVLSSPGKPLDAATRTFFEPRFGHDFGDVRIHDDAKAQNSARAVNALAYTAGPHIIFNAGQFDVERPAGRQLLAHELAHVVQQGSASAGSTAPIQRQLERSGSARALTPEDAEACSSLYLQKLCVYQLGGCPSSRDAGLPSVEEMADYNTECRNESGFIGPDVGLDADECQALQSPKCERGTRSRASSDRVSRALELSLKYMPAGIGEELGRLVTDKAFIASLVVAVGVYLALWFAPEPVFTKIVAAATTLAILATGVFSISTINNLAEAWLDLQSEAEAAASEEALEEAARKFGTRMGALEANLLIFLASLLVGGKLPGPKRLPTSPAQALGEAESTLATAAEGTVVAQSAGRSARVIPLRPRAALGSGAGEPAAVSVVVEGNTVRIIERAPLPAEVIPPKPAEVIPIPRAEPAPAPAAETPAVGQGPKPVIPVVPIPKTEPKPEEKQRPPFILPLPREKAPHLAEYQRWIGVLESDPNYERPTTDPTGDWKRALRPGGKHGMSLQTFQRGLDLGLDPDRIFIPDWWHAISTPFQVDHIIELQVTPRSKDDHFDSIDNFELLDKKANGDSGRRLYWGIQEQRRIQASFDPSSVSRTLKFDAVVLAEGNEGMRWTIEEIQNGEHLDVYEGRQK